MNVVPPELETTMAEWEDLREHKHFVGDFSQVVSDLCNSETAAIQIVGQRALRVELSRMELDADRLTKAWDLGTNEAGVGQVIGDGAFRTKRGVVRANLELLLKLESQDPKIAQYLASECQIAMFSQHRFLWCDRRSRL